MGRLKVSLRLKAGAHGAPLRSWWRKTVVCASRVLLIRLVPRHLLRWRRLKGVRSCGVRCGLCCGLVGFCELGEHIFNEDAIADCGVIDHDVGDGSDELAVLNDGRAAHALHDTARLRE